MATKKAAAAADDGMLELRSVEIRTVQIAIVGTAPLIMNRMSEKAKRQLMMGSTRKTSAEKAGTAKHDPRGEFLASPYRMDSWGGKAPTTLGFPASAFKGAMETAALETPGAKKAQIGRLVRVPWHNVPMFGVPRILCSVVRSADQGKTPDVRTRCILPEWACSLEVSFVVPTLTLPMVATLLINAGIVSGIGDWRQEKGAGSFGSFKVVEPTDADFVRICASGGLEAQERALQNPEPFDTETADLLAWFGGEVGRRGLRIAAAA